MSGRRFSYGRTITGLSVTFLLGGAYYAFADKIGWIIHDQGPIVAVEKVDTYPEAAQFSLNICDFTDSRFSGNWCSYGGDIIVGTWIFDPDSTDRAISYHASGWNRRTNGVMLARTDDEEFNRLTYCTFKNQWLPDKLARDGIPLVFLGHYHVAKNGKEDPRPFKNWMWRDSLFWDLREDAEFTWLAGPPKWITDNYEIMEQ